jgi:hypothetical protein
VVIKGWKRISVYNAEIIILVLWIQSGEENSFYVGKPVSVHRVKMRLHRGCIACYYQIEHLLGLWEWGEVV